MKYSEIPAFRILLIFLFGVILGILLIGSGVSRTDFIIIIMIAAYFSLFSIVFKYNIAAYLISILASGVIISMFIDSDRIQTPKKIIGEMPALIQGRIVKIINEKDNYIRCIIEGEVDSKVLPKEESRVILIIWGLKGERDIYRPGTVVLADALIRLAAERQLPTDFPEDKYCLSQDVKWLGRANTINVKLIEEASGIFHIRDELVARINNAIYSHYGSDAAGIVRALITGDKGGIPKEHKDYFSMTGTAHVLAVSGLHVGIIASIIYFLLGFVTNRWLKFIIFTLCLSAFVILSGMQPSGIRAGIMAILILYIKTRERRINLLNIVSIVILAVIDFNPNMIFSAGFQMSALAVLGIALLYQPIVHKLSNLIKSEKLVVRYLINSIAVTISASITVAPIVAYYFNIFSVISPLANLFVVPLMTFALVYGVAAVTFSYFFTTASTFFAASSEFCISLALEINSFIAGLPLAYISGDSSIYFALGTAFLFLYLFFSDNFRQLFFRATFSIISLLFVIIIMSAGNKDEHTQIVVREQYTALILRKSGGATNIVISDRRNDFYPSKDISMINYINQLEGKVNLFLTGACGEIIFKAIEKKEKISVYFLNHDEQNYISGILGTEKLFRIIEFNNDK